MKTLIDRVNATKSSTTPGIAEWAAHGLTEALAQQGDQMIADRDKRITDLEQQLAEAIRERDQARRNGGVMGRHGR